MSETLSGVIERVTFHNPENGFAVLRVEVKGQKGLTTVIGQVPRVVAGEYLEASGTWEVDPEHGQQFKAQSLRTLPPNSREGIEKFLASGLIKGIGKRYAKKIVDVFGERTLEVIDASPTFLNEVKGIGKNRIQRIRESWQEQKAVRDILIFLQAHDVGTARAVRIYKTYGNKALDLVRSNPYRLAEDIWGIGFQTADKLAASLGIEKQSPLRARAALHFTLGELRGEGHCGYPESGVLERTQNLTGIRRELLQDAVDNLVKEKEILRETWEVRGGPSAERGVGNDGGFSARRSTLRAPRPTEPWLYLRPLFYAETGIARSLSKLREGPHPLPNINIELALDWVEKKMSLTLASNQSQAIREACTSKVLVITGGPGVGKTTIVRGILEIFLAKKVRCALCAPTGRAAKRLAETTGQEAKTIHRLLEYDPGSGRPKRDADRPLELDLLIVDEMSMVDVALMHQLVRAVPLKACLVLVGDADQLPSVGPGTVLGDILASEVIPAVRLTEIFRQAQESGIIQAAHRIQRGEMPISASRDRPGDFYLLEAGSPAEVLERIVLMLRDRIPKRFGLDPLKDVQVLTPMNKGDLGTRQLNVRLQQEFNPPLDGPEAIRFGTSFRVGDKVLQTVNNYQKEVFNGDVGRILAVDPEDQELTVQFEEKKVVYDFDELDELTLAYALTIHKSQGSEYPGVVIALHQQHHVMLQRNLIYTALTRGKKLVVIVGQGRALSRAIQCQDPSRRFTALGRRLQEGPGCGE